MMDIASGMDDTMAAIAFVSADPLLSDTPEEYVILHEEREGGVL